MLREFWVLPDADRPIRLRCEHKLYGHWGARSGYPRFVASLDSERFSATLHGAKDSHEECPGWLRPVRPFLIRGLQRRRMKWYKVSDLNAELALLGDCLGGKVDLVHFLDGEHSGQFLPHLLRRIRSRVRTVATFHQPPELLDEILDPTLIRHLDHVILMSPSQRPYFEGKIASDRISVILHGIDTAFFHPRTRNRSQRPIRCITAGHWLRDWELFRAVAQQLPQIEFHAVTSRETGADHLSNVYRHERLSDDALAAIYRRADILFMPLQNSTANNALLEGMASGLPVVATDLIATRTYLAGKGAIFSPQGDVGAAVAAIERLAGDPSQMERLGREARAQAETLDWTNIASEHAALFEYVCGRGKRPRTPVPAK